MLGGFCEPLLQSCGSVAALTPPPPLRAVALKQKGTYVRQIEAHEGVVKISIERPATIPPPATVKVHVRAKTREALDFAVRQMKITRREFPLER